MKKKITIITGFLACIFSTQAHALVNEKYSQSEIDILFDDICFDDEEIEQLMVKKGPYEEKIEQVAQMAGVHIFIAALAVKEFCSESYTSLKKYLLSLVKKA